MDRILWNVSVELKPFDCSIVLSVALLAKLSLSLSSIWPSLNHLLAVVVIECGRCGRLIRLDQTTRYIYVIAAKDHTRAILT